MSLLTSSLRAMPSLPLPSASRRATPLRVICANSDGTTFDSRAAFSCRVFVEMPMTTCCIVCHITDVNCTSTQLIAAVLDAVAAPFPSWTNLLRIADTDGYPDRDSPALDDHAVVRSCGVRRFAMHLDGAKKTTKAPDAIWVPAECASAASGPHDYVDAEDVLIEASAQGDIDHLEALLIEVPGIDVDASDATGATALHHAAKGGHLAALCYLIRHGADVNAIDKDRWTALHYACDGGHCDIADLLLSVDGIDATCATNDSHQAWHLAREHDRYDIVALFEGNHPELH